MMEDRINPGGAPENRTQNPHTPVPPGSCQEADVWEKGAYPPQMGCAPNGKTAYRPDAAQAAAPALGEKEPGASMPGNIPSSGGAYGPWQGYSGQENPRQGSGTGARPHYPGGNPAGPSGGYPIPPKPPHAGMSQGTVIGLVVTCCVTVFLCVLIFTAGLVIKAALETGETTYGEDAFHYSYGYDGYGDEDDPEGLIDPPGPDGTEEDLPLPGVHTEGTHNAIQFLVSGLSYATGEELDGVDNGKEYLVMGLQASNMGEGEAVFRLSQFTLEDREGNLHTVTFPEYSYGYGLLPDAVTLQPRYTVRGVAIFECDRNAAKFLHIYEADGCLKLTVPLPEELG